MQIEILPIAERTRLAFTPASMPWPEKKYLAQVEASPLERVADSSAASRAMSRNLWRWVKGGWSAGDIFPSWAEAVNIAGVWGWIASGISRPWDRRKMLAACLRRRKPTASRG